MKVISFVTRKGGSGKSTLSINLAVAAEAAGEKVLLLDCDEQRTLSKWAERRTAETPVFDTTETIEELRRALKIAYGSDFTLAVIDTPGFNVPIVHEVVRLSDLCVVPTRPSSADIEAMGSVLRATKENRKKMVFVVNQASPNLRSREAANGLSAIGEVCPVTIGSRVAFQDSIEFGRGVIEISSRSKSAHEIVELWAWLHHQLHTIGT